MNDFTTTPLAEGQNDLATYEALAGNEEITALVPMEPTELEPYAYQKPASRHGHFQALGIKRGDHPSLIMEKLAMLTSYTGVPSFLLDQFLNMELSCYGVALIDVDPYIDRTTGEQCAGYQSVLLKVLNPENTGKTIILRTSSKQILNLTREALLPFVGWFDWPEPVSLIIRRNGQAYGIQFLD